MTVPLNDRQRTTSIPRPQITFANSATLLALAASAWIMIGCDQSATSRQAPAPSETAEPPPPTPQQDERAVRLNALEAKANQGDTDAQLALAKLLLDGKDPSPNFERVKMLLDHAADNGIAEASLGLVLLKRFKALPDDRLPSVEILEARAMATHDPFVTAMLFPTLTKPSKALSELANNGYPLAMSRVLQYLNFCIADIVRSKTAKIAVTEFCRDFIYSNKAFDDAVALGTALIDKKDIDADKRRYWVELGRRLSSSRPSNAGMDPLSALQTEHVFRRHDPYFATIAGALNGVGELLKDGLGGSASPVKAATFFRRAAELGDPHAQTSIGELYQVGRGVPQDHELAARYFAQAAQQADDKGARNLGLAYAEGRGVPKDLSKAYFWLSIASMGRSSQFLMDFGPRVQSQLGGSAALRDKIGAAMSSEQIAEAQRLVREWRPSPQNGEPRLLDSVALASSVGGVSSATKQSAKKAATGTIFWVNKAGYGITNHHLVDGCTEVHVQGRTDAVTIVTADQINDLALLQIGGGVSASALISAEPGRLRQGEDIVVFGFPLNSLLSSGGNLTLGVVSASTGLGNNTNQIQITASIQPGSSGSPVLNKRAEVVAVVSMKLSDSKMAKATGSIGQNVNFAVSGQTLRAFLDANSVEYKTGGMFTLQKGTADIADEAKRWTGVVECWR